MSDTKTKRPTRNRLLQVRLRRTELELIKVAAGLSGEALSTFGREAALERARRRLGHIRELLDQTEEEPASVP